MRRQAAFMCENKINFSSARVCVHLQMKEKGGKWDPVSPRQASEKPHTPTTQSNKTIAVQGREQFIVPASSNLYLLQLHERCMDLILQREREEGRRREAGGLRQPETTEAFAVTLIVLGHEHKHMTSHLCLFLNGCDYFALFQSSTIDTSRIAPLLSSQISASHQHKAKAITTKSLNTTAFTCASSHGDAEGWFLGKSTCNWAF